MSPISRPTFLAPLLTGPDGRKSAKQRGLLTIGGGLGAYTLLSEGYKWVRHIYDAMDTWERTRQIIDAVPRHLAWIPNLWDGTGKVVEAVPGYFVWIPDLSFRVPLSVDFDVRVPIPAVISVLVLVQAAHSAGINFRTVFLQLLVRIPMTRGYARRELAERGWLYPTETKDRLAFYRFADTSTGLISARPGSGFTFAKAADKTIDAGTSGIEVRDDILKIDPHFLFEPNRQTADQSTILVNDLSSVLGYKPSRLGILDVAKLDSLMRRYYREQQVSSESEP
jgi:hypothetical protein